MVNDTENPTQTTATVYELATFRPDPHLVFPTLDGNVSVIQLALIDDWIAGRVKLEDDILMRSIINDWKMRALCLG